MKQFLTFVIISVSILIFASCGGDASSSSVTNTNLSAIDFSNKMQQIPDAPVIDVRTPGEFEKGHIQNAKNIDWNGDDFKTEILTLDKSKPVFVYCLSGGRSSSAASFMRENGFMEVYELQGGMMNWRASNLPETTDDLTTANTKPKFDEINKEKFDEMINTDKVVLVDFYADWCAPCKKMKPYLEEISTEMADKVLVIRINADDNQQLCKDLKVDALPVLHIYKNKALVWNNSGFIEKEEVVKQLK